MIAEYIAAFHRCYPHKACEVRPVRKRGEVRFRVLIDNDGGEFTYSDEDLREATRMFLRGKR